MTALLQLEDGTEFQGEMFGAKKSVAGEIGNFSSYCYCNKSLQSRSVVVFSVSGCIPYL